MATGEGRIASISQSHPGSRHDLTIRRGGPKLPNRARRYVDSACQGYDKEHPDIDFSYKNPKHGELTEEEKQYNRGLGSFRVAVSTALDGASGSVSCRSATGIRCRRTIPKLLLSPGW